MVDGTQPWAVRAAELSVLWYTAGKGEEDMAVHHFERLVDEPARPLDLRVPHRFATVLPASPLSYDGADRESVLVRAAAAVPAAGPGIGGRSAVSLGQRAASEARSEERAARHEAVSKTMENHTTVAVSHNGAGRELRSLLARRSSALAATTTRSWVSSSVVDSSDCGGYVFDSE